MRRSLTEIVLMENTVSRAVSMLQPLLELGNLRHLNEDQLRQIARSISETQSTRLSKNEAGRGPLRKEPTLGPSHYNPDDSLDRLQNDDLVPWPTEPE
jgi:hypothetical protein